VTRSRIRSSVYSQYLRVTTSSHLHSSPRHGYCERSDEGFKASCSQEEEGQGVIRKSGLSDNNSSFIGTQLRTESTEKGSFTDSHTQDISLSTDSQIFEKLVAAVRQPFIPLYERFPLQTLQLSAAIFSFLFHEKIVMQLTAGNKALQLSWENVAEALLSGVLVSRSSLGLRGAGLI
jgi:hypothetical protein